MDCSVFPTDGARHEVCKRGRDRAENNQRQGCGLSRRSQRAWRPSRDGQAQLQLDRHQQIAGYTKPSPKQTESGLPKNSQVRPEAFAHADGQPQHGNKCGRRKAGTAKAAVSPAGFGRDECVSVAADCAAQNSFQRSSEREQRSASRHPFREAQKMERLGRPPACDHSAAAYQCKRCQRSSSRDSSASEISCKSERSKDPIPYPLPAVVGCPFADCPPSVAPFVEANALVRHLREQHNIVIRNVEHVFRSFDEYLRVWATLVEAEGIEKVLSKTQIDGNEVYVISDLTPEDKELRERLRREKLEEMLRIQEQERCEEGPLPRKCLFCKIVCENRTALFNHMFVEHGFNIGLPDNLVGVSEFLNILDNKLKNLQCINCEKTFTSSAVLRKHMRKKKHFRISKTNYAYDRFYIVNLQIEPGRSWEELANEKLHDSDDGGGDDSWNDWVEPDSEPTMCLFDEEMFPSPADCLAHMRSAHGFDLHEVRKSRSLDFHGTVALINHVRVLTARKECFGCGRRVGALADLAPHMAAEGCAALAPPAGDSVYSDPKNLFATYADDPLLWGFASSPADEEEDLDDPDR